MDELDRKILRLLSADGRMTVKDIARQVSLTSPAVSERIRRMEKTGVIAGYTVVLGDAEPKSHIDALISISVAPADRQYFITMVENQPGVAQCFHVTGSHSFIVKVSCAASMSWSILSTVFRSWGRRAPRSFYPRRWTGALLWMCMSTERTRYDLREMRRTHCAGRAVL